jgi:hypothetical protein
MGSWAPLASTAKDTQTYSRADTLKGGLGSKRDEALLR